MKEPFVDESARLFCFYEKGKTPNGGALNDETQCYLDTMSALQRLIFSAQTDYNDYLEEQWTKKDWE